MTKAAGGRWYRPIQLDEGEDLLYEAHAIWKNATWLGSGQGKLYLTTKRLIWARHRISLPLPRQPILVIPVGGIFSVEARSRMLGDYAQLGTRQGTYQFRFQAWPWESRRETMEAFCDMVEKLRGSHETRG
jgi:hypothetical protein